MILANKVVIITGASSGIGHAAARLFAKEGAQLVLVSRRQTELGELLSSITASGGQAVMVPGDVRQEQTASRAVEFAVSRFGGLDIAFNNAGTLGAMGATPEISLGAWHDTLDTNLTSAFLGAKYQIPAMLKRGAGTVILTSTFVGYTAGIPGAAAYAASKSALIGLTQSLAAEFGPQSIRVNALLPGGTDTPMAAQMNDSPEAMARVASMHALKRIATPQELAQAALFLASDASSFMTGAAMLVDGGVSIGRM